MGRTGLRRGEALGLRLEDLDLAESRISIRQNLVRGQGGSVTFTTPKNHQARTIDLDPNTVAVLRTQKVIVSEQRLAWGESYVDHGLLFAKENGLPLRPDTVSKAFVRLATRAVEGGLVSRRISLHSLRHSHGSIGIAAGVPVKVMSERLGHSSPAFTMSVYQHTLPGMQREAAALIAEIVRSAGEAEHEAVGDVRTS